MKEITKTISAGTTYKKAEDGKTLFENGEPVVLKTWGRHDASLSTAVPSNLSEAQINNLAFRLAKLELQYGISTWVRNTDLDIEPGTKHNGLEYLGDGKFRLDVNYDASVASPRGKKAEKIAKAIDAAIANFVKSGIVPTEDMKRAIADSVRAAMA